LNGEVSTIFKDQKLQKKFMDVFNEECFGQPSCVLKPEDTTLYYKMTDFCKDRITHVNITSHEYIAVAGCKKDTIAIPGINVDWHKEKIGLLIVGLDVVSVCFIFYMFSRLEDLNGRMLDGIDCIRVQMTDYGVRIRDLKLDKYTQNPHVQQMRIWTHITGIMRQFAKDMNIERENPMEVIDVTLSIYTLPEIVLVMSMQDIKENINRMKNKMFAQAQTSGEQHRRTGELIKEQEKRLIKLKEKYRELTIKKDKYEVKT